MVQIRKFVAPLGALTLKTTETAVIGVTFGAAENLPPVSGTDSAVMQKLAQELTGYFAKMRTKFDLPLEFSGTSFQEEIWQTLLDIPYHEVRTYGEIAALSGHPLACRAVGMACHANPIAILIPCHRVIASGHKLGGFGGGEMWKKALLAIENNKL